MNDSSSSSLNVDKKKKKSRRRTTTKSKSPKSSAPNPNKKQADPNHVSRTPEEMMAMVESEIKALKLTVKAEFKEMVSKEEDMDQKIQEAKENVKGDRIKKLKGNELAPREHLNRLGFDNELIIECMEAEVKKWKKKARVAKTDKDNVTSNIQQMIELNKQSEQAVTGASQFTRQLVVDQEVAKTKCNEAEIELFGQEELLKHRKNVVGVEISTKGNFKKTIKDIVKIMNDKCTDQKLLRDVLKLAGNSLSTDLGMSSSAHSRSSDSSSVSSDTSESSTSSPDDDTSTGEGTSHSRASSIMASSVSVSSPEDYSSSSDDDTDTTWEMCKCWVACVGLNYLSSVMTVCWDLLVVGILCGYLLW